MKPASERNRRWREKHPEHYKAIYQRYNKKKYAENKKAEKERIKEWGKNNPDKIKAQKRRWYLRHRDKILAKNKAWREKYSGYSRKSWEKWEKNHPELAKEYTQKSVRTRRAKKAQTYCDLTIEEAQEVKKHGCLFCGSQENLQLAHDIPLSLGGPTVRANILCLCKSCNVRMHDKPLNEMIEQKILLEERSRYGFS